MHDSLNTVEELHRLGYKETKGVLWWNDTNKKGRRTQDLLMSNYEEIKILDKLALDDDDDGVNGRISLDSRFKRR
ncbi:hypothetical protein Tco_1242084, partial [Tanacetum coccineum]